MAATLLADDDSTAVSTAFLAHGVATMQQLDFASATRHGNMVALRPTNFATPLLLRSLLLTFPNSGTTATLKLGSCLAGHSMCTEYCQEPMPYANCLWTHPSDTTNQCMECKKPERLVQCGRGALLLRSREQLKAGHYLIKTHGVGYTSDATRGARADALLKYIERRFGVCGDASVHSVVRVSRNVFDSLGARFHYEKQHQRVKGHLRAATMGSSCSAHQRLVPNCDPLHLRAAHHKNRLLCWCTLCPSQHKFNVGDGTDVQWLGEDKKADLGRSSHGSRVHCTRLVQRTLGRVHCGCSETLSQRICHVPIAAAGRVQYPEG